MSCFGGGVAASTSTATYYNSSAGVMRSRPWRWWRAKCAGIAASVGAKLRRSIRRLDGRHGRRRRRATWSVHQRQHHQHRSFAPVYVDELYSFNHAHHDLQPSGGKPLKLDAVAVQVVEEPSTSGNTLVGATRANSAKATARVAAATTTSACGGARGGGKPLKLDAVAVQVVEEPSTSGNRLVGATLANSTKATARVAAATTTTAAAGARGGGKPPRAGTAAAGVGSMKSILLKSPGRGGNGVLGVVKGMGEVDLRAELFIRKFKEDMRLQSQRSAEEFQAMLARGL